MRRILLLTAVLVLSLLSAGVRSDDPVTTSVTFNREIVRILNRRCLQCHGPDGISMSLATYREARPWSRAIREELVERRMPPWRAASGYTPLATDGGLTIRELAVLLTWLDGGIPAGDERDRPRSDDHSHAAVDPAHLVALPAQKVPAGQEHVIRRVTVDAAIDGPRRVQRVEVRPGDRRLLRAAFVWLATPEGPQWLGAWTPWQPIVTPPEGTAFALPAGARLEVTLHYRGRDADLEDRSSLALVEAPADAVSAGQIVVEAPFSDGNGAGNRRGETRLSAAGQVWAVVPHMAVQEISGESVDRSAAGAIAGSLEVTARKPDGTVQVLLWIPRLEPAWPTPYVFREPIRLPAGTAVSVTATGTPVDRVTLATCC